MQKEKIKKYQMPKLNIRLLAVFFLAVFLISLGNFFVYSHLLRSMGKEENIINQQHIDSVMMKLDAAMTDVRQRYLTLMDKDVFRYWGNEMPSYYDWMQMSKDTAEVWSDLEYVTGFILLFRGSSAVVTNNGIYPTEEYFRDFYQNEQYNAAFWESLLNAGVPTLYIPETSYTGAGNRQERTLAAVAMQSVFDAKMVTVLMLDMQMLCDKIDAYLAEDVYIFTEQGQCIYSAGGDSHLQTLPQADHLTQNGERILVFRTQGQNGLVYVKLLPESSAMAQIRSSFAFCLAIALAALVVAVVLGALIIHRLMVPVNEMVGMLEQQGPHGAYQTLQQILQSREQQARILAQKDAALSEYLLQSRLKNVYVDTKNNDILPDEGTAYIIYIQVWYEEKHRELFTISWAELENCLQEMMSGTLSRNFASTMMFQLEPGRFIARVTSADEDITEPMQKFMQRLAQEQEFARFTVVQSQPLSKDDDLAAVYTQVQEAAKQAVVCDQSQLLALPLADNAPRLRYSYQDEQRLYACARDGQPSEAVAIVNQILDANLALGISHAQMQVLCVAMVNTTSYAVAETASGADKASAASGVYNVLNAKCNTAKDYYDAVAGFIRATVDSTGEPEQDDLMLQKIQQYLTENYHREFSGEEMAEALWVSRSYLSTYYKSKTGNNLSDSIQLYRVQKALELLKDPSVKVGQVGAMVGIPSSNTFLRQFKKYTGMTPKEYRLKNGQDG